MCRPGPQYRDSVRGRGGPEGNFSPESGSWCHLEPGPLPLWASHVVVRAQPREAAGGLCRRLASRSQLGACVLAAGGQGGIGPHLCRSHLVTFSVALSYNMPCPGPGSPGRGLVPEAELHGAWELWPEAQLAGRVEHARSTSQAVSTLSHQAPASLWHPDTCALEGCSAGLHVDRDGERHLSGSGSNQGVFSFSRARVTHS